MFSLHCGLWKHIEVYEKRELVREHDIVKVIREKLARRQQCKAFYGIIDIKLTGRWYYLDPTAVYSGVLPSFTKRRSIGMFTKVDYRHPFSARSVPLSPLDRVPYMGA